MMFEQQFDLMDNLIRALRERYGRRIRFVTLAKTLPNPVREVD